MDEPGDDEEIWIIQMIPKTIFLGAAITIIIFFAFILTANNIKTNDLEMNVFINRLLYSTNAIAYYDEEIGRSYLGRIDLDKLNSKNIEQAINYSKGMFFAANITLQGKDSVYYNKELYEKMIPLAKARIKGPGGADYRLKQYKVSYLENKVMKLSSMRIEIIKARS